MKMPFYALSLEDLVNLAKAHKLPPQTSRHMFNWYYKKKNIFPCVLHNFSFEAQRVEKELLDFSLPAISSLAESEDRTVKFLITLADGERVEAVLIPFQKKYTVCLSSQVGCLMKCSFCFTGEQGFKRHLKTEEIIGQFIQIQRWLKEKRPDDHKILNVVFMGQGEPLHNFDAVKKACEILICQWGLSLAGHKITVSTAGYLPGLLRWKQEMPDVNVALSLHSVIPEKRDSLIPLNRKYPLAEILPVLEQIPQGEKRFVTYEYLVLKDFNDSEDEIHQLGSLLKDKKAFINLIPFNPYPGSRYQRPGDDRIFRLKEIIESYGLPATVRTTKGHKILAACGQLNHQTEKEVYLT